MTDDIDEAPSDHAPPGQANMTVAFKDNTPKSEQVDRYRNRRRMAWISFACICVFGIALIVVALLADPLAARLDKVSFLLGTVFGVWGGVIFAYFGATAYTDTRGMR